MLKSLHEISRYVLYVCVVVFRDVVAQSKAFFGKGSGPILLDNLHCSTGKTSIFDCFHNDIGNHNCDHGDDAGVTCRCQLTAPSIV